MLFVNADILLLPDIVSAARQVAEQVGDFLMIGRRWDLDVRQALDFSNGWDQRLREDVRLRGRFHRPAGSDYFIFPRRLFTEMPDFAIGKKIESRDKQAQALTLRKAGVSVGQIAEMLGWNSHQAASKAIKAALDRTIRELADDLERWKP